LTLPKIIKFIPEGSRVLDLGCGFEGKLLKEIESKIAYGIGVDLSVNQDIANSKIKLIEHNLNEDLPFEGEGFDIVISLANLEHLNNPTQVLKEAQRVLKPGGTLLLTAPSVYGRPVLEFLTFLRLISQWEIQDHKNYFNKKLLLEYCKQAGFSKCDHKYFQLGMNNFLYAKK